MGSCCSKEKQRPKEIPFENIKNTVTGLSPKEIHEIQFSWKEMREKYVDTDVLIFKNFFEGCPSAVEKHSERLLGAIPVETNQMVFLKDKDAFAHRQPATVPIGAPPPTPPTSPLVYPPVSLEVGHYTWRCNPGFREVIKETCDYFAECVNALYDQQLFIEKVLKLGASHRPYGIRRKEIARFCDAVLECIRGNMVPKGLTWKLQVQGRII